MNKIVMISLSFVASLYASPIFIDKDTGLMWQDEEKQHESNWGEAVSYCANLTLEGYHDWRLPSRQELLSITDVKRYMPAIKLGLNNLKTFKTRRMILSVAGYWSSSESRLNRLGLEESHDAYDAWAVSFEDGRDYHIHKESDRHFVRCVRDGTPLNLDDFRKQLSENTILHKNILTLTSPTNIINTIKNTTQTGYGLVLNDTFLPNGLIDKKQPYSKKPFESIQKLTQQFMNPRKPIDISPRIPQEIEKPILPDEIEKPILPKMPTLVKSEFETKAMFQERVQQTISEREKQIEQIQETYRKNVEERNKKIELLGAEYTSKVQERNRQLELLQQEYDNDLKAIAKEQEEKKANSEKFIAIFNKIAFQIVMGGVKIKDSSYDAEKETMYVTLKATNADFEKKVSFNVPLAEAKDFKENLDKQKVKMAFDYQNNGFVLNSIEIDNQIQINQDTTIKTYFASQNFRVIFNKTDLEIIKGGAEIKDSSYDAEKETMYVTLKATNADFEKKVSFNVPFADARDFKENLDKQKVKMAFDYQNNGYILNSIQINQYTPKTYIASLTTSDFKPEVVKVALKDEKIVFKAPQSAKLNLQSDTLALNLQNPNLVDKYQVQALGYSESNSAKGLKYNDDLTPIVKKLKGIKADQAKWLFAIAVEKYDNADNVIYAKNSANAFIEAAQKKFGVSDRNTYALIEDKATSASIKDKLEMMLANVKDGDTVYFYYSGHGIPNPSDGEAYILPKDKIVDFVIRDKEFMVRNIYKQLSDSKASKVVAFMDSCFSGNTDGISNIKGVAATRVKTKKVEFDKDKMVVLTAGTSNQFSNAYLEKGHRLFSYYLTKAILERPTLDIDSIYKDVAVKVKDESYKMGDLKVQEPQIEGNNKLGI